MKLDFHHHLLKVLFFLPKSSVSNNVHWSVYTTLFSSPGVFSTTMSI